MSILRNPYNNVGNVLPPQPFGSVVDHVKNNENALIETAGLTAYNFFRCWPRIERLEGCPKSTTRSISTK